MTLEDLRAFVAAYRAKSMSEAARQLGCTQAAVAQHVRRLEHELGTELFSRMRRGVVPTDVGKTLYEVASSALVNLELAVREIDRSLEQKRSRLRITTSAVIANRYLRRAILALKERQPHVEIDIETENTAEDRLSALREGRADLAMIPLVDPVQSLEVRPCMKIELVLLVHAEHRFAARKRVHIAELGSIRYIAQSPTSATCRHIGRALREAGVALEPSGVLEDAAAGALMVELGRGETFVPAGDAARLARTHRVKGVSVSSLAPLQMGWVARNFSLLPDVAKGFLEICDELRNTLGRVPAQSSASGE